MDGIAPMVIALVFPAGSAAQAVSAPGSAPPDDRPRRVTHCSSAPVRPACSSTPAVKITERPVTLPRGGWTCAVVGMGGRPRLGREGLESGNSMSVEAGTATGEVEGRERLCVAAMHRQVARECSVGPETASSCSVQKT